MKDKIALFFSYFLPMSVKSYAMLDLLDAIDFGEMHVDAPNYTVTIVKKKKGERV